MKEHFTCFILYVTFLLILDSIFFVSFFVSVDLYIVGTANAGKSSLFNALLASDYCKSSARDLIERATVSVWPGDLKFVKLQRNK